MQVIVLSIDTTPAGSNPALCQATHECHYRSHNHGSECPHMVQPFWPRREKDLQEVPQVSSDCEAETTWLVCRILHSDASVNKMSMSHSQFIIRTIMGSVPQPVLLQPSLFTPPTIPTSSPASGATGPRPSVLNTLLWSHSPWLPDLWPASAFQKDTLSFILESSSNSPFTCYSKCLFGAQH